MVESVSTAKRWLVPDNRQIVALEERRSLEEGLEVDMHRRPAESYRLGVRRRRSVGRLAVTTYGYC